MTYKFSYYILFDHVCIGHKFKSSETGDAICTKITETEYTKGGSDQIYEYIPKLDKSWLVDLIV